MMTIGGDSEYSLAFNKYVKNKCRRYAYMNDGRLLDDNSMECYE